MYMVLKLLYNITKFSHKITHNYSGLFSYGGNFYNFRIVEHHPIFWHNRFNVTTTTQSCTNNTKWVVHTKIGTNKITRYIR